MIEESILIRSNLLYKCSLWSYFDGRPLEDLTMEEWNKFCERENISYLKDKVTIRYFDNKPLIGPRFIVETSSKKDAFELVNNHQGMKIGKIPVQFGLYFDKYKPSILVVGSNLLPTWDADRIIKLTSRVGAEILMVTIPPSSIRVTHYCYAQVRDKEQRDKLIKLSGNPDYPTLDLTNDRKNNNNKNNKQGDYEWTNTKSPAKRRNHKRESTRKR